MNVSTKLIISALGVCALPLAQAAEFEDFGKVVRVQPRIEQVRTPRQECRTDYVQAPVQQRSGGGGGAIIGGLVGGLLGNQVGSGNGRSVATAAGAIAGAVVGNNTEAANNNQPMGVQEQAVQRCRNVDAYEERTNGYEVTYEYRGRNYTEIMRRDPGQRIRLHVSATPTDN